MEMCRRVKLAKPLPTRRATAEESIEENEAIFLPGERGDLLEEQALQRGTVLVSEGLYRELQAMARVHAMDPAFLCEDEEKNGYDHLRESGPPV